MTTRAENDQIINGVIGIEAAFSIPVNVMRVEFCNSPAYLTPIIIAPHNCIPITTAFIFSPSIDGSTSAILAKCKSGARWISAVWTQAIFLVCILIDARSLSSGFEMFLAKLSTWRNLLTASTAQAGSNPRINKFLAPHILFLNVLFLADVIGTLLAHYSIWARRTFSANYTQAAFLAFLLPAFGTIAIHFEMLLTVLPSWLYWFIAPIAQAKFFFLLSVFFLPSFLMWFHNALHNHIIPLSYDGSNYI